jgi:protein-arginine kinase activator protein McsA
MRTQHDETVETLLKVDMELYTKNPNKVIKEKRRQMEDAVAQLDFETAAIIRDEIRYFEESSLKKKKGKK